MQPHWEVGPWLKMACVEGGAVCMEVVHAIRQMTDALLTCNWLAAAGDKCHRLHRCMYAATCNALWCCLADQPECVA